MDKGFLVNHYYSIKEEVIVQNGYTKFDSKQMKLIKEIPQDEFNKLITKCSENKISRDERAEFLKILKESFLYFAGKIKNNYDYNYIKKEIKINLKRRISDEWQNYEVVYYFISNEKYITL